MIVMDSFALPVEGTETRVNAQAQAYEYMTTYTESCEAVQRQEKVIGWYHSHPGYGCWLSGIDVSTQMLNQQFQEPFVAIVVKIPNGQFLSALSVPCIISYLDRSYSNNIGWKSWSRRFSHLSKSNLHKITCTGLLYLILNDLQGYKPADEGPSEYQSIPLNKIEDFGVHCKQYYSLDVSYFKSCLDSRLLDSLWNKYWVNTLSSTNLITVGVFVSVFNLW